MARTIELTIADDGSMTVSTGQAEPPEQEQAEGGQRMPVKSLDEALAAIKQLASAAAMPQDAQQPDAETPGEGQAAGEEDDGQEAAMMGSYRGGVTGR